MRISDWSADVCSSDLMALYGYRPYSDEPDDRPLPDARAATGAIIDIFDAMISTFIDTRLEPDLDDLLWNLTNVFHRAGERIQRALDDNEVAQQRSQTAQDGPAVKSVDLELPLHPGATKLARREPLAFFRDRRPLHFPTQHPPPRTP